MFNTLKNILAATIQTTRTAMASSASAPADNDSYNDDNYTMLDKLAFHCSHLAADLARCAGAGEEQNRLLAEYIERADRQHSSIADFADDLDWFNVLEPLSTRDQLRGKLVILDFFTYCCINCLHILPDLKRLEQLYTVADGLVVIGVHSAKFANEKDSANILAAVQRHNITHPVVNDAGCSMWRALNVQCWPTLVVLGPRANPLFVLMGEGNYERLEKYVGAAVKFYAMQRPNALSAHALPLNPAIDLIVSGALQFPGKIVCSAAAPPAQKQPQQVNGENEDGATKTTAAKTEEEGDGEEEELYAIVDTGHHRILVVDRAGSVRYRVGGKTEGFVDGDFRVARFNAPQGACFASRAARHLYVADTENHAIRLVDLHAGTVRTVAGTGHQGSDRTGGLLGPAQSLSSPWDVAMCRMRNMDMSFHVDVARAPEVDLLLIANTGLHQIWALFLADTIWWRFKRYAAGSVVALAGNGNEENRNNSYPQNAAFAQPSGLAVRADTKELFVADSESSAVRRVQLLDGRVQPVAGGDRNPLDLFAYGNVDGRQFGAKLQHPLGVAWSPAEQCVYVADTYNHRVKRVDPATGECVTCAFAAEESEGGSGGGVGGDQQSEDGDADGGGGQEVFHEPGGLCLSPDGGQLYVADTNNHRIVRVDLRSGRSATWRLHFDSVTSGSEVTDSGMAYFGDGAGQQQQQQQQQRRPAVPTYQSDRVVRLGVAGSAMRLQLTVECETLSDASAEGEEISSALNGANGDGDGDLRFVQMKLTEGAPQRVEARCPDGSVNVALVGAERFGAAEPTVVVELRPTIEAVTAAAATVGGDDGEEEEEEESGTLEMRFGLNVCAGGRCFAREFVVEVVVVSGVEADYVVEEESWRLVLRPDDIELLYCY